MVLPQLGKLFILQRVCWFESSSLRKMVSIVLVVSTSVCGADRFGSSPNRYPMVYLRVIK